MLLLSDLHGLFAIPRAGAPARKLAFYLAAMGKLRREDWLKLEGEVRKEVEKLREETVSDEEVGEDERSAVRIT